MYGHIKSLNAKKADNKITSAKFKKKLQFKLYLVGNSKTRGQVDPDERVHYELSQLDLQCMQIQLLLCLAL